MLMKRNHTTMKKITFTTAGIALLILLQLGTMAFVFFGRNRQHHERGHYSKNPQGCHVSFKGGDHEKGRGHGKGRGNDHHGPHRGEHGSFGPMFFEDLNLTKEQQIKIDALKAEHKKTEDAMRTKMHELRNKQFELLKAEKLDDAQAEAIAAQSGQYKKEEVLARIKFFRGIQEVLTKEQKDKLKERMSKHRDGRGHNEAEDTIQN